MNFNKIPSNLKISIDGVHSNSVKLWRKTVLASDDLQVDNTFDNPTKVLYIIYTLFSFITMGVFQLYSTAGHGSGLTFGNARIGQDI